MSFLYFFIILFTMKIIKKYLIKKITITSMSLFLLLLFIIIPTKNNEKINENNIKKHTKKIYLIDNENYSSMVSCSYEEKNIKDEVNKIIELLKHGTNSFDGIIPKKIKVNEIKTTKDSIYIDFDSNFKNIKNINKIYECIVYSLTQINGINKIYISVNNKLLDNMPLTKEYGINKEYDLDNFNDIDKTIIFFAKDDYYVPITKITNNKEEKIEIIIKELKSSTNSINNLNGYLKDNIKLIDYKINDKNIELVFNEYDFDDEKLKFLISTSIFENYKINEITIYNKDKSHSINIKK